MSLILTKSFMPPIKAEEIVEWVRKYRKYVDATSQNLQSLSPN